MLDRVVLKREMHFEARRSLIESAFVVVVIAFFGFLLIQLVVPLVNKNVLPFDILHAVRVSLIFTFVVGFVLAITLHIRWRRLSKGAFRIDYARGELTYSEGRHIKKVLLSDITTLVTGKWNFLMSPRGKLRENYRWIAIEYRVPNLLGRRSLWIQCLPESELEDFLTELNLDVPIVRS
jgi:hypothetical protein